MNIPTNQIKTETWQRIVAKYQNPDRARSIGQLLNTLVPYALIWYVLIKCISISVWLMFPLMLIGAGLLVRIFIIFHDCGHGSFFKSQKANNFWGFITGVLIFTPYQNWRHDHAVHHSHSGNLDHRGTGEIWTMTVQEYLKSSRWVRIKYRFARNPFCLFIIGPVILFLILQRIPSKRATPMGRKSVHLTSAGILAVAVIMSLTVGLKTYLLIQLPMVMMATTAGVWLFYIQHQFEGVYWERNADWDYLTEALKGSSFLKLPKLMQWFTGNIGFHHIHHLSPRIPNYFLERCYMENPIFQQIKPITFLKSFESLAFRLWDEQNNRLVGFDYFKEFKLN
jgi:omega-6 fatty acid desaturase (delta-12 desaturase)